MGKQTKSPEKKKILEFALHKFMSEGFYKTTMDDIAKEIRISKKTIYKNFASKEELIYSIVDSFTSSISNKIEEIIKTDEDSISKAFRLFNTMGSTALRMSDKWIRDIQIHMPELWKKIDEFRTKRAYAVLGTIIKQGQSEGMIVNKPAEIMIHLFVNSIRSIVNPEFLYYQKFNYKEAFDYAFEILFNGILTTKGKKQFDKIFKKVAQ